jgi:hypothetical protein
MRFLTPGSLPSAAAAVPQSGLPYAVTLGRPAAPVFQTSPADQERMAHRYQKLKIRMVAGKVETESGVSKSKSERTRDKQAP